MRYQQLDKRVMPKPPPPSLDHVDCLLLEALQEDCKQPLARLGERVGLSPPSVLERVRKLELAGLVTGYHAAINPRLAGLDVAAFIGVGIDHPRSTPAFVRAVLAMREVLECHHVTGQHSLLVKIRTTNTESLQRLISRLRELPGVARTETMVVLATQLERQNVPLTEPADESDAPPRRRRTSPRSTPSAARHR